MSFFEALYRAGDAVYGEAPDAFMVANLPLRGGTALDAGGGQGRHALWLARNGYRVDLVDASPAAVERCAAIAVEHGLPVEAQVADLRDWTPRRAYDLIVCAVTLHAFKSHRATAVAERLRSALAPGGTLYLSAHLAPSDEQRRREIAEQPQVEPRTYLADGHIKRLFSVDEMRGLLAWPAVAEEIVSDERCPRADCPYLHELYRGIANKPAEAR
ncbi:MAG: SAM-dependent methyltransferase [Vulcanimicrobiaceae bacterium]